MRFIILILFVFLASCATPQTHPQAFYNNVYAPGKVLVESNGAFTSVARVSSPEHMDEARKAAYLRLMQDAKSNGFNGVKIISEDDSNSFGYSITVVGKLYKSNKYGDNIYPVDRISNLLKGLSMDQSKKVKHTPVKKFKIVKRAKPVKEKTVVVVKEPAPVIEELPVTVAEQTIGGTDGPTVIMAPEGFVAKKTTSIEVPTDKSNKVKKLLAEDTSDVSVGDF